MSAVRAYYNENDPRIAAWLRELIQCGLVAPGEVDDRSIEDVRPNDLRGFTQHHFFAGIGVWSYALRNAGWPDSRPVWTASCPCQPFSTSGKKSGFDDERHLWPALYHLIREYRQIHGVPVIFGEQVASKAAEPWIDLVQADLEALDYAFGCVPFPSAGVGAPHIRDRAYWVAHTDGVRLGEARDGELQRREAQWAQCNSDLNRVGDAAGSGSLSAAQPGVYSREESTRSRDVEPERSSASGGVANTDLPEPQQLTRNGTRPGKTEGGRTFSEPNGRGQVPAPRPAGPTNGFWRAADWLGCRDGKWRPVEPGTSPLADGAPARVEQLRGYGNAINAEAAKAWIETVVEGTYDITNTDHA